VEFCVIPWISLTYLLIAFHPGSWPQSGRTLLSVPFMAAILFTCGPQLLNNHRLPCWAFNRGFQIIARAEMWFQISAPPAQPSRHSRASQVPTKHWYSATFQSANYCIFPASTALKKLFASNIIWGRRPSMYGVQLPLHWRMILRYT